MQDWKKSQLVTIKKENLVANCLLLKIFVFVLLVSTLSSSELTPDNIQQHITRLISQKYHLHTINLGKTINENELKAYVVTGLKIGRQEILTNKKYPSVLITSYMHPRQQFSTLFIQQILKSLLNSNSNDQNTNINPKHKYIEYMLDNGLLVLFPFVNIDGYYRYKNMTNDKNQAHLVQNYRKNMQNYGNCRYQWEYGVDINRNFNAKFGSLRTSQYQCGQQYRGPRPFSQKQSQAIKRLFETLKITIAIDVHSYGNQWIYPYASQTNNQKLSKHMLFPIYKQLFQQFRQIDRPMKGCYQMLGYTADGVYIDWALDQGALSFAIQIGKSFNDRDVDSQITFQVQQSLHFVLFKNSISYKLYSGLRGQLIIQSTSLIDFSVQIIFDSNFQPQTVQVPSRKTVSIQISSAQNVTLRVKNSKIQQNIKLSQLTLVEASLSIDEEYRANQPIFINDLQEKP